MDRQEFEVKYILSQDEMTRLEKLRAAMAKASGLEVRADTLFSSMMLFGSKDEADRKMRVLEEIYGVNNGPGPDPPAGK